MALNVDGIRKDFPILSRKINGNPLVYFDNAASTLKPVQVIESISRFYGMHYANVHRGVHTLSQEASDMYEEARATIRKFISARSDREIIFTMNATEALNAIAYGICQRYVGRGDEIILTVMEHHSNMLPWIRYAREREARIKYVDIKENGVLKYDMLNDLISERTRVIALTHVSNVLGTINDISYVVKLAREVDAFVVVDGAQSVPHMPINVYSLDIDFLAFSGHKMLGPTGIGVLWGREDILSEMPPFKLGGGIVKEVALDKVKLEDLPLKMEAGTPNIAGAIGLAEAAKYLMNIGMENVIEHEKQLVKYTLRLMHDELEDYIEIYGPLDPEIRSGIVTFNLKGVNPHAVGAILDSYGIAVRTGMHCAHPLHQKLNLKGTVRASYYIYNTSEEIEYMVNTLKEIVKEVSHT